MISTDLQFKQLTQYLKRKQAKRLESSRFHTINTFKWKNLMLETVDTLKLHAQYDQFLLDDIKMVVGNIPEENYIEAILNMQPYRPKFKISTYQKNEALRRKKIRHGKKLPHLIQTDVGTESSSSKFSFKTNGSEQLAGSRKRKASDEILATLIEQDYLTQELSSQHHPFSKVISGLAFLLENKYKAFVEKMVTIKGVVELEDVCIELSRDVLMTETFFKLASRPLVELFSASGKQDLAKVEQDISNFMVNFIRNNSKFVITLRKILRFAARKSREVQLFEFNAPIDVNIDRYDIPENLKIEGCYVMTTHELLQLSNTTKGKDALSRLISVRQAFFEDINEYIKSNGGDRGEVSTDAQLQIFKFLLCKLRVFAAQLQAQLLLLQILYGEEEISFQYDESSYIHSQLTVAFEAIRLNI